MARASLFDDRQGSGSNCWDPVWAPQARRVAGICPAHGGCAQRPPREALEPSCGLHRRGSRSSLSCCSAVCQRRTCLHVGSRKTAHVSNRIWFFDGYFGRGVRGMRKSRKNDGFRGTRKNVFFVGRRKTKINPFAVVTGRKSKVTTAQELTP